MADVCRVDTDSLETTASDIDKEKPKLDGARTVVGGITLRGTDFGRVGQSGPAAQAHAASVRQVRKQLEAASTDLTKLTGYLRAWKNKYETEANRAAQCLVNLRRLGPLAPAQPATQGQQ
jgi:hypothetical protein